MTETATMTQAPSAYASAGLLLESIAAQDFDRLRASLAPEIRMRALVGKGLQEFDGPQEVADKFAYWFGDTQGFELLDATVGELIGRIHLSWRIRLRAERLDNRWHVVEQQSYADCSQTGLLTQIDLVCSGYLPERQGER